MKNRIIDVQNVKITISKEEVINKLGTVTDEKEKKLIDKVCFNSLFFGTEYRLEEVTA